MADPADREQLAALHRDMSPTRMVMYAGATWDWHRLHYDQDFAAQAKLDGPIVDGQLFGALLAEQILDHFGPSARIEEMEFRFRDMVYVGEEVSITGEVTTRNSQGDGEHVTCWQQVTVADRTCVTATTSLFLPTQESE